MAIVTTSISSEKHIESLQSLAFFVSLLLCSLEHSQWGNNYLIWPFGLADEPGDEQSMSRVITDFVLNTRNCYNPDYGSVRLSDWKLFVEFIGGIFDYKKKKNFNRISLEDPGKTRGHTKMDYIAHEQTISCRQSFAGHVVGSRPKKRTKNLQRMIIWLWLR